jgi:hypothetical protein
MDDSNPERTLQPPVNAIPPQEESAGKNPETPPRSIPDPYLSPPQKTEKNTKQCRPDQTPWWKTAIELAAVLTAIWYAMVATRQLGVMKDQLTEMQRSGEQSTEQVWKAIGNLNWMARSADWSQKETQQAIESSERQSRKALQASIDASQLDQRAWVGVLNTPDTAELVPDGRGNYIFPTFVKFLFANTGKTPARKVSINWTTTYRPIRSPVPTYDQAVKENQELETGGNPIPGFTHGLISPGNGGEVIPPSSPVPFTSTLTAARTYPIIDTKTHQQNVMYVLGELTYFDVFDKRRRTLVCVEYPGLGIVKVTFCQTGNWME